MRKYSAGDYFKGRKGKYWYRFNKKERLKYAIKKALLIELGYINYAPLIFLLFFNFYFAVFIIIFIIVHELGHWIILRHDKDFAGFMIWPNPGCKTFSKGLSQSNPFIFLTGFMLSFLLYPFFIALYPGMNVMPIFYLLCALTASADFIMFVLWFWVNRWII